MEKQVSRQTLVTVANGAIAQTVLCDPNSTNHVFSVERVTATAGTVTITARAFDGFTAESVYDAAGGAITVSLAVAGASSYKIADMNLHSIVFDASGENGTWKFQYSGA